MDRVQLLRDMVNSAGFGLEIGPSHAPVFPKRGGYNVEIADYTSADVLRKKYQDMDVDASQIEEVDYVLDGKTLLEAINHRGQYDFIFSSHAIEHVVDIVDYLKSCQQLLKPDGVVAFAVPDKRHTFDVLRPTSTTGQVLEVHARSLKRHPPAAVFDFEASFATLNEQHTWKSDDIGEVKHLHELSYPVSRFQEACQRHGSYQDIHGWVFTPASFQLIMLELKLVGAIGLSPSKTISIEKEFYSLLTFSGDVQKNRVDVQYDKIREDVLSGIQILAGKDPYFASVHRHLVNGALQTNPTNRTRYGFLSRVAKALRVQSNGVRSAGSS